MRIKLLMTGQKQILTELKSKKPTGRYFEPWVRRMKRGDVWNGPHPLLTAHDVTLNLLFAFWWNIQAEDEETRRAAKEAEKKALAEALANKERRLRASLKAAEKSRRLEKLDNTIAQAKDAKMPSTCKGFFNSFLLLL